MAEDITFINPSAKNAFPEIEKLKLGHPLFKNLFDKNDKPKIPAIQNKELTINDKHYILNSHLVEGTDRIRLYIIDNTRRKRAEQTLRETKDYLEKLINHANAPIIVWGPEYEIIRFNRAFEHLTGYENREVVGKKLGLLFPKDSKKDSLDKIEMTSSGEYWQAVEIPVLRKDGSVKIALWNSANIYADDGTTLVATIAQGQDITEMKRIDRAKTEFISLAAHQLRTPLATISLTSEMMLRGVAGEINKEGREYLESIFSEVKSMSEMIETFLNVSRIEMGTFPIEPRPTNLIQTADKIISGVLPQIESNRLKLKKKYSVDSLTMNLDPKIMRIVIENLLSNAIKYTAKGGTITLEIKKNDKEVLLTVADTGCGIPRDQQEKVFDKLYRATNVLEGKTEGSGLGLYLVRSVLEQSSGKVWLESGKNKGTIFYVSLPPEGMKKKEAAKT
jgi:PAS domain S-box-containing protein